MEPTREGAAVAHMIFGAPSALAREDERDQIGYLAPATHPAGYTSDSSKTESVDLYNSRDETESEEVDELPAVHQFEPIHVGDRQQLFRLASSMSQRSVPSAGRRSSVGRTSSFGGNELERKDTLAGVEHGDPVLDPGSEKFDAYKWARMMIRTLDDEGFKQRRAGVVFKNLNVSGSGSALNLQNNVGSIFMSPLRVGEFIHLGKTPEKKILRDFDGVLKSGEMLVVLGRPGSGCSTLLKTICGELSGLDFDKNSTIHYNGITQKKMLKEFRGEVVYNQEVDKHFPHLTVGQTLEFAAEARTPSHRAHDMSRKQWAKHMAAVVMALFGLSHTYNTKVGNDFVRGVSGGERKRVSIAEMALAGAPIAAWDNSTRGLDAATALKFVKSLRMSSNLNGSAQIVAIYQASQAIYEIFDKVVVLYEGRQIFFGRCDKAEKYFTEMGWENPARQTVADFLTSVTNPQERKTRKGMDKKVPRTPDEFVEYWKKSSSYKDLQNEIEEHEKEFPMDGSLVNEFTESKKYQQAKHTRVTSPYLISVPMQVKLCTKRAYQRIWMDKTSTVTTIFGQIAMALIIGSIFYGTPNASAGFFAKGATLFFAILLNALISISEINALYEQRPIVEKQASYAFYHPWTEAFGGIVSDIPVKFVIATAFNVILYFLANLRREPSQFFIFFLFTFISILVMSALFRTLAAATKTISQALAFAGVLVLIIVIYTGFVIPRRNMHPWFSWLIWINPIFYAFEGILVNEFHGREFTCSGFYPNYAVLTGDSFICSIAGAVPGDRTVSGDAFAYASYEYSYSHIWRNFGILVAMFLFFEVVYLVATELNSSTSSAAEFLVFRRGHVPKYMQDLDKKQANDEALEAPAGVAKEESGEGDNVGALDAQKDIFTWRNVKYDIPYQGGDRRLLDNVSGWVKPGTLTALMGTSGAGKTTLLDVLAQRVSFGVITGDMFVNGKPLDQSFQRKTGYVQQQDLHLETTTVREALRFSAMLRQPKSVPKQEKFDFVEDVIKMLAMEDFAEAVVGVPGEGLNVEQRKLLTIGVELAAKPALLIFLDEPTSGLDSQSSWAICAFLRKLADHGQAVLCTIHQPSAILFQEFDRLLFLAKGGKTVYFGEIGEQSRTMLDYFEGNGSRKCEDKENPAEFLLEVGNDPTFVDTWKKSDEAGAVQKELDSIHKDKEGEAPAGDTPEGHREFAMPFTAQLQYVTVRVFQQYWRTPSYVLGKFILGIASALFISFSFYKPGNTQQGFQDIIFAVFMITTIFTTLVQQIMPRFVTQRSLYEVRERPSKAYSWKAFMIANIVVELPYQILLGVVVWACWYYPVLGANQSGARQVLILLFLIQFFVFASTFAHMIISALPDAQTAGNIATLMFSLTLTFNGVFQPPNALPGFWIFMYRVSPLTYLISGIVSTGLGGTRVQCGASEYSVFPPPTGQTCGTYLATFLRTAPGYLEDPNSTTMCQYCPVSSADQFLAGDSIYYGQRWRNFGIVWAYIIFNIFAAVLLYYIFRVKQWSPSKSFSGIRAKATTVFKHRGEEKVPEEKKSENPAVL